MNSSTKPEAFSFNTEFGEKGQILNDGMGQYKRYRQSELDAACDAARQEGLQSVEAETQRRIAASAEAIAAHLLPVLPFARQLADQMRREAAQLALQTAKTIAGSALAHVPEEAIQHSLGEMVSYLPDDEKLVLSVHPDVAEQIEAALRPKLPADANLVVEADPRATSGAWKLNWDTGGFSHDPAELTERIEGIVADYLQQPIEEQQGDLFASIA